MKLRKLTHKKSKAQAMVEFAIALPLLLLLLYGILEAGRLLFLYSTVVTASRQAVRYGSATGENASNVARYGDCNGIRAAAQSFNYLGGTQFVVTIYHDSGPGTGSTPYCSGPTDGWAPSDNNQRITVTVSKQFSPIVRLVPFSPRTITATSSRTILNSVAIVVEQPPQIVVQDVTEITIDADNPDPSELGQSVTVTFTVTDTESPPNATTAPTGDVVVSGGDADCTYTLVETDNGIGFCTITFSTSGAHSITATYGGDDEHLASSSNPEAHMVQLAQTVTTIVGAVPSPSIRNQDVLFTVTVTGGSTTPTGTVNLDAGGNRNCTITLSNGVGSCTINFNQLGNFTITANYNGDGTHDVSSDTANHQVLAGTATPSLTPTRTPIPTITMTPTITVAPPTPTLTATAVPSCTGVTHGPITKSGNTMSMTINNNQGFPITFQDVTVTWNEDKGHQTGSDKSLILQGASLGGVSFWTGNIANQSTYTISASPVIPAFGSVSITFTFHQSYDNFDGTERIYINLLTRGCESNPIQSN